jgi:hypothetical protein
MFIWYYTYIYIYIYIYNIGLYVQRGSRSHGGIRSGCSSAQTFDGESECESLVTSDALSQFFWDAPRGLSSQRVGLTSRGRAAVCVCCLGRSYS